ncbi:MAG: redoxin domain-containing protein [Halanaerobiales bacterium]
MGNLCDLNRLNKFLMIVLFLIITISLIVFRGSPVLAQFETGSAVSDFELEALDGKSYQLSQFYNKQDHLLLYFLKSDDPTSIDRLQELIAFFKNYQPRETYQIIAIVEIEEDNKNLIEELNSIQDTTEIPLLILLNENNPIIDSFQIKNYPTILLLRYDLKVRREFSGFSSRQEKNFYQYLSFTFTKQNSSSSSGCEGGVCPPPEGY